MLIITLCKLGLEMSKHSLWSLMHAQSALCTCGPSHGLSVSYKLPTIAEISWKSFATEQQNTIITGYTVQVVGSDSKQEIPVTDPNATTVEVPGLKPFTSYTFNISAMTKVGTGPVATVSSTTPKEGELTRLSYYTHMMCQLVI